MSDLEAFLEPKGWRKLPKPGFDLFCNDYAALHVVSVSTAEEIEASWTKWQERLSSARQLEEVGKRKDLYLLMLLDEEEPDAFIRIQSILDDTHVCRKSVLLRRGRSLNDTLQEASLFQDVKESTDDAATALPGERVFIDNEVLTDLAKKGVTTIFERILANQYKTGDATK